MNPPYGKEMAQKRFDFLFDRAVSCLLNVFLVAVLLIAGLSG